MAILGISAYYHDSAAAIVSETGRILAAVQEERFARKKFYAGFPRESVKYCLEQTDAAGEAVTHVVFYEKPRLKFSRILDSFLTLNVDLEHSFLSNFSHWAGNKVYLDKWLLGELGSIDSSKDWKRMLYFAEHHESHAASAYFPSPFEEAVIVTLDGVGEYATTSVSVGRGNTIEKKREIHFPHSLGLLYSAFTYYTGFKVNSGEYKMMGLAPYGEPRFVNLIKKELVDIAEDGSFSINPDYFDGFSNECIVNKRFEELFKAGLRNAENRLTVFHADIAASIQAVLEEIVLKITRTLKREFGIENLCMAGGVALNCVANGRILRESGFKKLWVQPAAGDAGGALGAALYGHYEICSRKRDTSFGEDFMQGAYLGPEFSDEAIETCLARFGAASRKLSKTDLVQDCAQRITEGAVLGWFQGRMEYGPRALGNRSILADSRPTDMQQKLNLKIKKRESFRPFAPAILKENLSEWFELNADSPYMNIVCYLRESHRNDGREKRRTAYLEPRKNHSEIPAVTHVDYSARVQTIRRDSNPLFHALVTRFFEKTGCPVVVNTSFNVRGEPIVCNPDDAFRCFMNTNLDYLAIGSFMLAKTDQDPLVAMQVEQTFDSD